MGPEAVLFPGLEKRTIHTSSQEGLGQGSPRTHGNAQLSPWGEGMVLLATKGWKPGICSVPYRARDSQQGSLSLECPQCLAWGFEW